MFKYAFMYIRNSNKKFSIKKSEIFYKNFWDQHEKWEKCWQKLDFLMCTGQSHMVHILDFLGTEFHHNGIDNKAHQKWKKLVKNLIKMWN